MLTVGSLFAGIGGLELGLERTGGFKTVWQVECDEYATQVLERHWPGVRRWGDVRTFPPDAASPRHETPGTCSPSERSGTTARERGQRELEPCDDGSDWHVDLICGGFPCQDISYAGKGAGLDGERSGLWYEFARVVRILEPRYVLVENVSALLTRGLDAVLGTLASLGYDAWWDCLQAANFGAPHIRDRVFVIASTNADIERRKAIGHADAGDGKTLRQETVKHSGVGSQADVADAARDKQQPGAAGRRVSEGGCSWWSTEPDVGRVADGVPARVDRLRCLGNAVVPQVAEWIGNRILEAMEHG